MSEGRRAMSFTALVALVVALAAGAAAGYIYQRQERSLGVLGRQLKEVRDRQKGAEAAHLSMKRARLTSSKSVAEGMQGIWAAVRGIQKNLRAMDGRIAKLEEKLGGSPALAAMQKRLAAVSARSALLQARVEALERRKGGRGKTIYVGDRKKPKGARGNAQRNAKTNNPDQPPFWNGCIDSLNKSARLSKSAETVCDCIVGRIRKSDRVSKKDRLRILRQSKFTTRVRGVSGRSQKVLENAVVQCALRHFKKKKKN